MRESRGSGWSVAVLGALVVGVLSTCGGGAGTSDPAELAALKSRPYQRAARRAYDGAPPVVPHGRFGADCGSCHGDRGVGIEGLGYSPPSPHDDTPGMGAARCRQCHVTQETQETFVASRFRGLEQEAVAGPRHHELAPPMIPHRVFMREDCLSCHDGLAAREDIRTSHPERIRCRQCHLEKSDA